MIDFTTLRIRELDIIVSEKLRNSAGKSNHGFVPNSSSLKNLHKELFGQSEFSFAAGVYRTLPLKGGATHFAPAYQVPELMETIFSVERVTTGAILAWTHDVLEYIHPFLDGNRRTTWIFTNMWLTSLGYTPIDWEKLRPSWEGGIRMYPTLEERLVNTLKELSK